MYVVCNMWCITYVSFLYIAIVTRYLRQMSHAYRARMNIRSESNAPERLKLHDFISKRKVPGESQKAAVRMLEYANLYLLLCLFV